MPQQLAYVPLEPVPVPRPVDRIEYVVSRCAGKRVVDLGCYDETALVKRDTDTWLHGRIAAVAAEVVGIDNSAGIPAEGLRTGPHSVIVPGDASSPEQVLQRGTFDLAVAGELIEHLPDALGFLKKVKASFAGRQLILTTPNATSVSNAILGLASRESNHKDHLQIFSYKTLHTLCLRAGFEDWTIVPYHVHFSEMILRANGASQKLLKGAERMVNTWERFFPMQAGGLILDVVRV